MDTMIAFVTPLKERDRLRFCYTPSRTVLLSPIRLLCIFLTPHLTFAHASCMGTSYTTDGRDKREGKGEILYLNDLDGLP